MDVALTLCNCGAAACCYEVAFATLSGNWSSRSSLFSNKVVTRREYKRVCYTAYEAPELCNTMSLTCGTRASKSGRIGRYRSGFYSGGVPQLRTPLRSRSRHCTYPPGTLDARG